MCDKLPYCNPRVDECLVELIRVINLEPNCKTLACCCGHGKYPKTIVVKDNISNKIFELFSEIELGPRKRNRYYKSDKEGFYYIPETIKKYPSLNYVDYLCNIPFYKHNRNVEED